MLLLTLACLLPFSGKAFHIDDPLFIWTAQHITNHPLDFYGFPATWWSRTTPMWYVQQNPPGASYYMAIVGSIAGWSERALHVGFLLPAIVVVLTTHRLAQRFTRDAFLAAVITLVAPGFLVSATTLMCDVSMLALWMLAILCWLEGLDRHKPLFLAIAALLIAACALTKYFGIALLPLLFAYTWIRERSLRRWIAYLMIPLFLLAAFQWYSHHLYGQGLLTIAALFQGKAREEQSRAGRILLGLVFAGGCTLPALTFAPRLWSHRKLLYGVLASACLAALFYAGWINVGTIYLHNASLHLHRLWIAEQLLFYVAAGLSIVALALADLWDRMDSDSWLLLLWVAGTFFFSMAVNWDVNARSLLPMIPAVAILIARRLERFSGGTAPHWSASAVPLAISLVVALWVATGDMALANSARAAANSIHEKTRDDANPACFEGRWGFEYYMLSYGARPADLDGAGCAFGSTFVLPRYNTETFAFPLQTAQPEILSFPIHTWISTMNYDAGAGFYFSGWGPLPFVFGPVPPQQYKLSRVVQARE